MEHIRAKFPSRPQAQSVSDTPCRTSRDILNLFPVEVLVLDHSRDHNVAAAFQVLPIWYSWLEACKRENRPELVLQVWQQWATGSDRGPLDALQRKFLSRMGYESRYELLDTVDYGSPVTQSRLVILSYRLQDSNGLASAKNKFADWYLQPPDNLPPRPMSNCLRPFGAVKSCFVSNRRYRPEGRPEQHNGSNAELCRVMDSNSNRFSPFVRRRAGQGTRRSYSVVTADTARKIGVSQCTSRHSCLGSHWKQFGVSARVHRSESSESTSCGRARKSGLMPSRSHLRSLLASK